MQGKHMLALSTRERIINLFSAFIANAFWPMRTYTNSFQYCSTRCMLQLKSIAVIQTVQQQFTYCCLLLLVVLGFGFFPLSLLLLIEAHFTLKSLWRGPSNLWLTSQTNLKSKTVCTDPSRGCLGTGLPKALKGKTLVRVESSLWGIWQERPGQR